jgi:hypothetical protein
MPSMFILFLFGTCSPAISIQSLIGRLKIQMFELGRDPTTGCSPRNENLN